MTKHYIVRGSRFLRGVGAQFEVTAAEGEPAVVRARLTLDDSATGPPGFVHGGLLAALLDEAMGIAAHFAGSPVVSANLNLNYLRPVPLGEPFTVAAHVQDKDGRKVTVRGEVLLPDGQTATTCTGLFIEAPNLFNGWGFTFTETV